MRVAIAFIKTVLADAAAVVTAVGERCYYVQAPQDLNAKDGFIQYNLLKRDLLTKDGACEYDVRVSVNASTVDQVLDIMEVVEQVMGDASKLVFNGTTEIERTQDDYYQIDINYELTI